jgi:DNA replication licensing factor MCM7
MCRFDILWLILDRANEENDRKLADHVLQVHQHGRVPAPESEHAPLTPEQLRTYVAMAKQHAPKIPEDLTEYVASIYGELRRQEAMADRPNSYTTPRTLLSILRLSQALAKLRFDNAVCPCALALALQLAQCVHLRVAQFSPFVLHKYSNVDCMRWYATAACGCVSTGD